jgi:hypothetical protein
MFKKTIFTSLVLLALKGGYAQNIDSYKDKTLPVIPVFDAQYDASISLVGTEEDISWKSRYYKKDGDYIGEVKGFCNLDISFLFLGVKKVHVGFITRMNYTQNTIETITYNNGAENEDGTDKKLNEYEKKIAKQESIDTLLVNDISLEFFDYNLGKLVDVENDAVISANSYGLQESYFIVKEIIDKKNAIKDYIPVHLKGKEYLIPVETKKDDEEKYINVNLINPNTGESILDQINWLRIYYNKNDLPYKVIAEVVVNFKVFSIDKEIELNIKQ